MFYHPKMISGTDDGVGISNDEQVSSTPAPHTASSHAPAAHRTLIPVDGFDSAQRAIAYIIRAARQGAISEIHLINVQPSMFPGDFAWNDVVEDERHARLGAGEAVLEHVQKLLNDNGVACKTAVRFGSTAKIIVQYAREHRIDAIVMGTRSRRLIDRLFRRSVAAQVARMTDIPVMILNPGRASARARSLEKSYSRFTPILAP